MAQLAASPARSWRPPGFSRCAVLQRAERGYDRVVMGRIGDIFAEALDRADYLITLARLHISIASPARGS
jgi:hypothetical protein